MKNILTIWGGAEQGKSATIKNLIPLFETNFPKAKVNWLIKGYDIKLIIEIEGKKIGVESQGDPNSRLKSSITDFAKDDNCDLIICASRTRGETVKIIKDVAKEYNYNLTWATNYRSSTNQSTLNQMSAEHIFQLILTLI
ncbi:hypothetical protein [Marinifilum fragile]|uniref:hypothetical protein n=1 Tax=Marinifilum fragile TaxID=570161 RepID=UPI002AA90FE8|nr:hypothetical protein [Marinifilum fragile]